MAKQDFIDENRAQWTAAVLETLPGPATAKVWLGPDEIEDALQLFVAPHLNHVMLPNGGGNDFIAVEPSIEPGCLEFIISEHHVYLGRPSRLTLEKIGDDVAESFLLLELANLKQTGTYEDREIEGREELLEVGLGRYHDRAHLDQGYLDHDEYGDEIPIPENYRLLVRWLNGKMLFVAKASMWNGYGPNYDGRHNSMNTARIRGIIERSIAARDEPEAMK